MILKLSKRSSIALLILVAALLVSTAFVASAQTNDPFANINYPIAELGGCENRDACESYCNTLLHINECISYAETNGLLSNEEVVEARAFANIGSSGPGGCESRGECDRFCSDINNIKECIAFGEEHGLMDDEHREEARKILSAIEGGAKLPGGCSSKESCEAYCENGAHISECVAFAEVAGLISEDELVEIRKFEEILKEGGTPGNCQGHSQCEAYCNEGSNFDECITFAERTGVVSPEELEMFKKTGGKGPGGCKGRDECDTFCNNPANQRACFEFAKEHDLLSDDDKGRLDEGLVRIREGFSHANPEVLTCLERKLGADTVEQIKSGEFFPSPTIGDAMQGCFEEFDPRGGPEGGLDGALNNAPPEVKSCIENNLGRDGLRAIESGDFGALGREGGETIKGCFDKFGGFGDEHDGRDGEFRDDFDGGRPPGIERAFEEASPQTLGCISTELGHGAFSDIRDGNFERLGPEAEIAFKKCFNDFGDELPTDNGEFLPQEFDLEHFDDDFKDDFRDEHFDDSEFRPDERNFRDDEAFKREFEGDFRHDEFNGSFKPEDDFRDEHFNDFREDAGFRENFRLEENFDQGGFVSPEDAVFIDDPTHLEPDGSFKQDFPEEHSDFNPTSFDQSSPSTSSFDSSENTIDVFINEPLPPEEFFNDSGILPLELRSNIKKDALFANVASLLEGFSR